MAKLAFDNSGELYANISADSRLKVWEVASGAASTE
jgi:hypothetical protein